MEYEEKLRASEARAAAQLAALDAQYQGRLMGEVERYSALAQEKEALNERRAGVMFGGFWTAFITPLPPAWPPAGAG